MASPDTNLDENPESTTDDQKAKLSLEIKVDAPSACKRHITVSVSREDVDRYFDDAFGELMPKAEVPGFRAGRAPKNLVKSRFKKELSEQSKGSLLMDSMAQVSEEEDFSAISEPDLNYEAVIIPDEGPLTFEFDLEVRPDFDMPEWKGLSLNKPTHKFTKKEIDDRVTNLLSRYGEVVDQDAQEEIKEGDIVTVDITFEHGDENKEISSLLDQVVRIKPNLSFRDAKLEGFEKLMVGAKVGDVVEGKVEISEGALNEDLQKKKIDAKIKILSVKRLKLPKLDEQFLEEIGGFESEEQLRDLVEQEMERQLGYHQQRRIREQITEILTKDAGWELPEDLLKRQSHRELERAVLELRSSGFGEDVIQAHANEIRQNSLSSTATAIKEHFILERIAEDENLDAEQADYDKEIVLIAAQSSESPRRVRARLEKQGQMDALRNQIIERKAIELITSEAETKEEKFKPDANDTEAVNFAICGEEKSDIPEAKQGGDASELKEPTDHS